MTTVPWTTEDLAKLKQLNNTIDTLTQEIKQATIKEEKWKQTKNETIKKRKQLQYQLIQLIRQLTFEL